MKLQIVSDLHLEFERNAPVQFELPITDADVIVLAGDIGVGFYEEFEYCKHVIKTHNKPVIFVLGNHSFYANGADVKNIRDQWRAVDIPNLHYLDEGISTTIDGVRFMGGTLWTDFVLKGETEADDASRFLASMNMNDFRNTIIGDESWTPKKSVIEHWKIRLSMTRMFDDDNEIKTVVVTHHLPSYKSCDSSYRDSEMNPAYASHMDEFVKSSNASLWIHGHTHRSADYNIGDTRILCNPRGYYNYDENKKFNPELVVEI
jgi:Icc-related predicted phosphoesterase